MVFIRFLLALLALFWAWIPVTKAFCGPSTSQLVPSSRTMPQPILVTQLAEQTVSQAEYGPRTLNDESNNKLNLDNALLSFNSTATQKILSEISELREQDPTSIAKYLEGILNDGPDGCLPVWAKSRKLSSVGRFSKRARLGSLRRLLDIASPTSDDMDEETKQQRRRRTLLSVFRELAQPNDEGNSKAPAIVVLEKKARREMKSGSRADNLRDRLPPGLETPEYTVISEAGSYEIRNYKPYSVCTVSKSSPRPIDSSKTDAKVSMPEMKGASAFGALAGYLFGKNQQSTAMKMTTPVISSGADESEVMAFVLPSTYWNEGGIKSAPQPFPESGVNLKFDRGGERAVRMFGGIATKNEVEARSAHLLTDLGKDKEWEAIDEPVSILAYNDPFTPPWKRLNEVSIGVRRRR